MSLRNVFAKAVPMNLLRRAGWMLLLVFAGFAVAAAARSHHHQPAAPATQATVRVEQLPAEAQATLARIHAGGPFPYAKDGAVFGNYEGLLPQQPRGWYHEYTVVTPGAHNRGARRIIAGGRDPARAQHYWYTGDHYQSFREIIE